MWPVMVEFRSASSEIRGRKKERKEESVVKSQSAGNYVGRHNNKRYTTPMSETICDALPKISRLRPSVGMFRHRASPV